LFDAGVILQQQADLAAALRRFLDRGDRRRRPIVSGSTMPGNSSMFRTGRMIVASSGITG
jgi:hypothetical protein